MQKFSLQKYFYLAASALLLVALPVNAQTSDESKLGPNLVQNASFENGTQSWSDTATVVSGVAHSGSHSLYYNRTNSNEYTLFTQRLDVDPGDFVHFSVWIKGKNIKVNRKHQGASVYMESSNDGKFLGGEYPDGFYGTFDWKRVSLAYRVPAGASRISVGVYMGHDVTGTAWFDDVSVRVETPQYFKSYLQTPNYRGLVKQGGNAPWKLQVEKLPHKDWIKNIILISTSLVNADGKVLLRETTKAKSTDSTTTITLSPHDLAVGDYTLKISYAGRNGIAQQEDQHSIHVVKEMPDIYVDAEGFTVVDGKRFFPMGVYLGVYNTSEAPALKNISESGFNTVLSYLYGSYGANNRGLQAKGYMANAEKYDLKVVYDLGKMYSGARNRGDEAYDIAAQYIENLKEEPALLAWYTNDEKGEGWLPKIEKRYAQIKRLDPDHLVFQVQNKVAELKKDSFSTDVLGSDPYPVRHDDLSLTSERTKATVAAAHGAKGVWIVPQIADLGVYYKNQENHPPSLDEMRNQAYQAIIHGATGLIWYSYYDLLFKDYPRSKATMDKEYFAKRWADVTAMAKEIKKIVPVVLENHKVALSLPANSKIQAAAWQDGDELLIMLANPYYEENSITFALPKGWKIKDANQGQIKSTFANGKVTFTLPSVGSGVFRLVK